MSKKKTAPVSSDQTELLRQEIANLNKKNSGLEKDLAASISRADMLSELLSKANDVIRQAEMHQLGFRPEDVFIQELVDAQSQSEAQEMVNTYRQMDRCIGARVIRPKSEVHGWCAQLIFCAEFAPCVPTLFQTISSVLAENQRFVIVPAGQMATLSINV